MYDKSFAEILEPLQIKISYHLSRAMTMKSYGPYMRNGKQFWCNYHRLIKRKDAKALMEVQYMNLKTNWTNLCQPM